LLADANVYQFSSKEKHLNSGLVYYLYRYSDPNLQRWLNRDPIGELGGVNLYQFVQNNPLTDIDFLGWDGWGWLQNVGAACRKLCSSAAGAGPANAAAGAGTSIINGAVGVAKAGPGLTANAALAAACNPCKSCMSNYGCDPDADKECDKICQHCEDVKNKLQNPIKHL
jgi:RHS repeat-associated protein